jgi:UDP-N-acetylmuramoylalanine--D-glutamate ligase
MRPDREIQPAPRSALVIGFARTGEAVARALRRRGATVTVTDDRPDDERAIDATALGCRFVAAPDAAELARLARDVELVVVSPGVPPSHPVFAAGGAPIVSEVELAYRLSAVPIVGITGTNGKTTVSLLVAALLNASGLATRAVGNIGTPLIAAIEEELDVLVCELSSFQLAFTTTFRPMVATWLNLAEDHLDWHPTLDAYIAAKARIFAAQGPDDVAIGNCDDPIVEAALAAARAQQVRFAPAAGDYRIEGDRFVGPGGTELATIGDLPRALPHDRLNALAALATAIEAGASPAQCAATLQASPVLPHRVALVASIDGVDYYDDSKATTPSAVTAALAGFATSVLIAGGRNKGLDLHAMRAFLDGSPANVVRGVVAIGEAAPEIEAAFASYPVRRARSMDEAVELASAFARRGDAVLLSPGCASFDWYSSYEERGEDFARAVADYAEARDAALDAYPGRFGH